MVAPGFIAMTNLYLCINVKNQFINKTNSDKGMDKFLHDKFSSFFIDVY